MAIINQTELFDELVNDLTTNYDMTTNGAKLFAVANIEYILDEMWDAYSKTIEYLTTEDEDDA